MASRATQTPEKRQVEELANMATLCLVSFLEVMRRSLALSTGLWQIREQAQGEKMRLHLIAHVRQALRLLEKGR